MTVCVCLHYRWRPNVNSRFREFTEQGCFKALPSRSRSVKRVACVSVVQRRHEFIRSGASSRRVRHVRRQRRRYDGRRRQCESPPAARWHRKTFRTTSPWSPVRRIHCEEDQSYEDTRQSDNTKYVPGEQTVL